MAAARALLSSMPTTPPADELFDRSTMTFGEHLEELRKCLFKAVYGLAIGFAVGLLFGSDVVKFIQRPLLKALTKYYQNEDINRVHTATEKLAAEGGAEQPWTEKEIEDRVQNQGLLAEEVYIDPAAMLPELKRMFPEQFKNVALPQRTTVKEKEADAPNQPSSSPQSDKSDETGKDTLAASTALPDAKTREEYLNSFIHVYLWRPSSDDPRMQIKSLNAQEPFAVYVKASLLVGVLLSSPWIFIQIWSFVAAGLYPHERHYVQFYLPFSIGLFLVGAALAFFVVFQPVLNFLFSFNRMTGIAPEPRINEWLSFVLLLPVGFGVGFQLPLVMLFLERIGLITIAGYLKQWRIAVLVIFVIAALLTPPDPNSMMLLACPLTILYFGGILLCKLMPRHETSRDIATIT
jgi:sec-independent protein translocase protein TatC